MTPLANDCLSSHLIQLLLLHYLGKINQTIHALNSFISTRKTSINSIYPDLWPPTASRLQDLTVIKQCVYQMTFTNVYEFKKGLVKSGLVWSRTLSILLSMNAKSASMLMFAQCVHISSNFAISTWKTKQLDEMSAKVSRKLTKYVLCVI